MLCKLTEVVAKLIKFYLYNSSKVIKKKKEIFKLFLLRYFSHQSAFTLKFTQLLFYYFFYSQSLLKVKFEKKKFHVIYTALFFLLGSI